MANSRENPIVDPIQEKQKQWDEASKLVDTIVDALGHRIDPDIKETVIGLKVLGFETRASCEGHTDSGIASPWVDISPISGDQRDEMLEELMAVDAEIEKEEAIDKNSKKVAELYDKSHVLEKERKTLILPEIKRLASLLEKFYASRSTDFETRIILDIGPWSTRMECQGAEIQNINDPETKSANLAKFQAEFRAFTEFLKKIYFS